MARLDKESAGKCANLALLFCWLLKKSITYLHIFEMLSTKNYEKGQCQMIVKTFFPKHYNKYTMTVSCQLNHRRSQLRYLK